MYLLRGNRRRRWSTDRVKDSSAREIMENINAGCCY
jgi:hypothetical protein